ncbi:GIY-YIG nuclease family protein [Priestia koreensis]|uniref:LuxR family transcriptional regulator n=1 Tax=Priestia koreensis TaxID=284581 RepID=A0A0M0KQS6_9BACI|nr:GIY-YIG nuclease family protein [Priestia koreensis]KOO41169.1 LuxR family transcriptional regulator [Priestia koreensis]
MDRKKELKSLFKEKKVEAGVYQIKNNENGKIFVGSTPNLRTLNGKKFELTMGTNTNRKLQNDWNSFGQHAFSIEVLEVLKEDREDHLDTKTALKKLEQQWIEKVNPYDDRGYHTKKDEL